MPCLLTVVGNLPVTDLEEWHRACRGVVERRHWHMVWLVACGHFDSRDSSKNRHATKHVHATGHPIVQSFEPGED